METFYIVQIIEKDKPNIVVDYPKDFPIPDEGDELVIVDDKGWEHSGVVTKKRFVVREFYRELTITLDCTK